MCVRRHQHMCVMSPVFAWFTAHAWMFIIIGLYNQSSWFA